MTETFLKHFNEYISQVAMSSGQGGHFFLNEKMPKLSGQVREAFLNIIHRVNQQIRLAGKSGGTFFKLEFNSGLINVENESLINQGTVF